MEPRQTRAKLEKVEIVEAEGGRTAVVELLYKGVTSRATAGASPTDSYDEVAAVAEATLEAAKALAESRFSCTLLLAQSMEAAGTILVLVNAMLYFNGRAIPVYGACTIRQGA